MRNIFICCFLLISLSAIAQTGIFGSVRGVVHDPQHRPIANAHILLRAGHSDLSFSTSSNTDGAASALPMYLSGTTFSPSPTPRFADFSQTVTISSDSTLTPHIPLDIASVTQSVSVQAVQSAANVDTVTPQAQIDLHRHRTLPPGADRTNSLAMVTDFVPGAYMTHDMLHMRGGHELSW